MKDIAKMSIADLERDIILHNELYFVKHAPIISDAQFDQLVLQLKKLKPDSQVLAAIGSDLTRGKKITHAAPMLSLDKCYDLAALNDWLAKISGDILATPKMDGVALSIVYDEAGHLSYAATRGSGNIGEDVTKNAKMIDDIPKKIKLGPLEVRGEVYMRLSIFKQQNAEFKSPRNLAAGAIKQKDPQKTADYQLNFFAYELLGRDFATEIEKLTNLNNMGFKVVPHELLGAGTDMQHVFDKYQLGRSDYDYEIDGVVYKANDTAVQISLGASSHHPRWAIAYKFQGDAAVSILRHVEWGVSRNSIITPVAIVDPVLLSGASVTRVSLHNAGMLQKLNVSLGAQVEVVRRGGVIPHLDRVIKSDGPPIELPSLCPACGSATFQENDFLYCSNVAGCREMQINTLKYFADIMEIDAIGEQWVAGLYDAKFLLSPADFYRITKEDLMTLPRMGEVLANKMLANIKSKKQVALDVFLRALGIRSLAKQASVNLAKKYGSLAKIVEASVEQLAELDQIGLLTAEEIVAGLSEKRELIDDLLQYVTLSEREQKSGKLAGLNFLFTGKMTSLTRGDAEQKVSDLGGDIAAGVSKDLDYLVIGGEGYQNRDKGNKWIKAENLIAKGAKIKIISEEEFNQMLLE